MSKPKIPNHRKANIEHKKRTERYVQLIQQVYDRIANEAARRAAMTGHNPDKPFSFDDYPETREAIKQLQTEFISNVGAIIMSGTSAEWKESNLVQDLVAKKVLTAYTSISRSGEEFERYFETNPDSLKAFQQRRDNGMKLSDRVWNLSEQYKAELETAIDSAIAPGRSAQLLSQDVRRFLNEPDLMFRRFRYKDDEGRWRKKWKKRVTDEDGKIRFIDCEKDSYRNQWTGPGYYKSSYKNAMRLARTEINMAYRTAEQKRWEQFDFVVGYEVKTTQNGKHETDICDELAGKYPKTFQFVGWHPHCLCYCIPILKTEDEFWSLDDDAPSRNEVTDVPQNFKDWVADNQERIERATDRGKLPYFLRDNQDEVDKILYPEKIAEKLSFTPLSIEERAAIRHANRTQEEIDNIQSAWNQKLINDLHDTANSIGMHTDQSFYDLMRILEDDNVLKEFSFFKKDYQQAKAILNARIESETALIRKAMENPDFAKNMQMLAKALGIEQGDFMTYYEANLLRGNPNYSRDEIYRINCQTCVVVYELRRRGFDVQALGNIKGSLLEKLSHGTNQIWRDANGNIPQKTCVGAEYSKVTRKRGSILWTSTEWHKTVANRKQLISALEQSITEDGRYHIDWYWNTESKKYLKGHIITLEKIGDTLRYYDPQNGKLITNFYEYINDIKLDKGINILRVDNLRVDVNWASKIVERSGATAKSGSLSSGGTVGHKLSIEERAKIRHEARSKEKEEFLRRWSANHSEYGRLLKDTSYTAVEFDKENGGLKAMHVGHIVHASDKEPVFFSRFTSTQLEERCQNILFKKGYACILENETKFDHATGNQLSLLDTKTNGEWIDIRSITSDGKNTIRNAVEHKKNQIQRFMSQNNEEADSLILYFEDASYFNAKKVKKTIGGNLRRIICVLNKGTGEVIEITK